MVSVCMATKNGATFIGEQLESILSQLGKEDEVIVSDDCSRDETVAIIRSFRDSRIVMFENGSERGIAGNFQTTLEATRGQFIFLADQDDIWLPGKISKMERLLNDFDLVVCDCQLVDRGLRIQKSSFYDVNRSRKGFLKNLFKNSYMGCCMAFTEKLKRLALPFPADIPMHDIWIGLVAEMYLSVYFMPEVLVLHRRHDSNASTSGNPSLNTINKKLAHRYRMVKNLFIHRYYAR